jgi:hypothetical protein
MTGGNFNKTRITLTFLAVFLVMGQKGFASLNDDSAAMMAGRSSFAAGGVLDGYVDYAVYAPGKYDGTMSFNNYVYAYQVFSNQSSTVSIDYLSVGLEPAVSVSTATYDPAASSAVAGGSVPSISLVLPQQVLYLFQFNNISASGYSRTLLFTSDASPEMAMGAVSAGFAGGATMALPTPLSSSQVTPEPATFGLLIGGVLMAIRRKTKV